MAFWKASQVSLPYNSKFITVNDGDDVAPIKPGYFIQIGNSQVMEVKTRNTENQTIELAETYTGTAITNQTAIAAPTQGQIADLVDAVNEFLSLHQTLSDSISASAVANSLVQRNNNAQVVVGDATAANHAMAFGQYTDPTKSGIGILDSQSDWPNTSVNDVTGVSSGIYRVGGSFTDKPSTRNFIVIFTRFQTSAKRFQQIFVEANFEPQWFWRTSDGGTEANPTWNDYIEFYHSGNSKNSLDYGIGQRNAASITDFASLPDAGMISWWGSGAANKPNNIGSFGGLLQIPVAGSNYLTIYGDLSNELYFKYGPDRSVEANKVYHSDNLNPNSFGLAANDLVAKGSAASSSVAVFELPLISKTAPTSLSVTGTFKIKNPASGSDLVTGITAVTIAGSLNAASSDRWAYVVLTGLSGLTFNHSLHLIGESSDANIKVNF